MTWSPEARALAAMLLFVPLSAAARPQESPPADATNPAPAAPSPQDPAAAEAERTARRILDEAIAAQDAGPVAKDVEDFRVTLKLQFRDPERGTITLDAERDFKMPDLMRTSVRDQALSGSEYIEGWDGKTGWHRSDDGLIVYDGPDFKTDRARLRDDVERTRLLLRFFFLENLAGELTGLAKVRDEERTFGSGASEAKLATDVLRGRGRLDEDGIGDVTVTLWIGKDEHRLLGARVERDAYPDHPLQFWFWHFRRNPQGIVTPGRIELFERDEKRPSLQMFFETEEADDGKRVNAIRFNTGLSAEHFAPAED